VSSPPQNVTSAVTSNKITVEWDYPQYPGGVLWGYRITVRNGSNIKKLHLSSNTILMSIVML
jgi:hypothetical protein